MEGQIKCFSDKVKFKKFIITKPLLYEMLKGFKKKKIENRNNKNDSKLTVINNHTWNKNKLSKQLEQEQNHRNGDHMEGYEQGSGRGREGGRYRE